MYIGGTRVESAKLSRAREPGPESTQIVADAPPASIEDDSRTVSRAACDGAGLGTEEGDPPLGGTLSDFWQNAKTKVFALCQKSDRVLPTAGSSYPVTNSAPSQAARETHCESSQMRACVATSAIWDDSPRHSRATACACRRRRIALMYIQKGGGADTEGQTPLRTGPAPAAPAGPNGVLPHLSE